MFSPSASSRARIAWRDKQKGLDPQRLVCIDEAWASTNMTPRYARCERGKRLVAYAPFGHWKTTPFLVALRHVRITAPCGFDCPIEASRAVLGFAADARGALKDYPMTVWPADKVERRAVAALIPFQAAVV